MTPKQLRALADALDDCDPPYYESSPQINRSLDACIAKAADYLREQAEPIDLDAVAMKQMRQAAAKSTWMPSEYTSNDWIADVCRWLRDGPPAAAPQAEPKREPLSDERIIEIQRAAYERAARECENRAGRTTLRTYPHYLECAAAIRALGRQRC